MMDTLNTGGWWGQVRGRRCAGRGRLRLIARVPIRDRAYLGVESLRPGRYPLFGSALPIGFLQRTLKLGADPSDHVDIISAQLREGTRGHRPACRGPSNPVEQRHLAEEFPSNKRRQVPINTALLPGHSDHASRYQEQGGTRPALADDDLTGGCRSPPELGRQGHVSPKTF